MPQILEYSELEEAVKWMNEAVKLSLSSPCKRDKRGVVIVKEGKIIGKGVNSPPPRFECTPKYCEPTCMEYTIHAEMNAIINAIANNNSVKEATMYHARSENGVLVNSKNPRCADCSKHILAFGISRFILKHEEGYTSYSANELNKLVLWYNLKK